jgi:uncharacterized protein YbjT (DUF2867 family)
MIAFVAGGTGLVGGELIKLLNESPDFSKIYALTRKKDAFAGMEKVQEAFFGENQALEMPEDVTHVFSCLGTTMKKAGSKEAFQKVDHDLVLQVGRAAKKVGAYGFHLVSALGADASSSIFYNRVKGQAEEDIKKLNFRSINIYQPSLLLGNRKEFRLGEKIGIVLFNALSFLFIGPLAKYKGIQAYSVAKAMIETAREGREGVSVMVSAEMQRYK